MNANRIQYLAQFIPDDSDYFRYSLTGFGEQTSNHQRKIDRFLVSYRDLSFGYHFVRALIKCKCEIPPDVDEQELIDFYWFERTGDPRGKIVETLALHHPSAHFIENAIQALLLTDASFDEVSNTTGISADVLRSYERLFFNVRDRREESLFIANVVYPEHRLVETMEGYTREADFSALLKRSAYNNGIDDVAYFIGLRVEGVEASHQTSAREMASRLESSIMANGYYLARNGFINQRSANGVASARSLLVAAKQGGDDNSEKDSFGASTIGDSLVQELQQVKGGQMRERIEQQQDKLLEQGRMTDDEALAPEE